MKKVNEIWNNDDLRCGGFYELSIEVSNNKTIEPIKKLIKLIFNLNYIKGPFTKDFEETKIDLENFENLGYIEIEDKYLPFKTFVISEEGEDVINWLDISIYTGILEEVLGKEYQTWATDGKRHKGLDETLEEILGEINSQFKIKLGMLGFEISGMYDLQWLKENDLKEQDVSHSKFFLNRSDFELLSENNKIKVKRIKINENSTLPKLH